MKADKKESKISKEQKEGTQTAIQKTNSNTQKISKNKTDIKNKIDNTIENLKISKNDEVSIKIEGINSENVKNADIQLKYSLVVNKKGSKYAWDAKVEIVKGKNCIKSVEFSVFCKGDKNVKKQTKVNKPYYYSGECLDTVKCEYIVNWASSSKMKKPCNCFSLSSEVFGINRIGTITDIFCIDIN